jgi:hypothetical protein
MALADVREAPARPVADEVAKPTPPVNFFAVGGALMLLFVGYVWIKWVSGPDFKSVPTGPDSEPGWMKTVGDIWQPAGLLAALGVIYGVVIRPWRRDGRPSTDGVLVIAYCTLWFQDPLSAYHGHWFVYNANLVNMGSWVADVPGWNSFAQPGQTVVEPLLLIGPVYVYFILIGTLFGCWVLRRIQARRPATPKWQLIAWLFGAMCLFDFVGEGLIWLPLGFWEYPGGPGLLFPSTYHKYPVNEMLTIGGMFTAITCLRYFRDDKGLTLVERGVDKIKDRRRQTLLRILAVTFAAHMALIVFYNVPNSWVGTHSRPWPKDITERSYFMNGICAGTTGRTCPGPGVKLDRDRGETSLQP